VSRTCDKPVARTTFIKRASNGRTPAGATHGPADGRAPARNAKVRFSDAPREVVDWVLSSSRWDGKPLAKAHVEWYLRGQGRDFDESLHVCDWLVRDAGIRERIEQEIRSRTKNGTGGVVRGNSEFLQPAYKDDDFLNAWGAIDRVDLEADLIGGSLRVWFQDRYEWHPDYSGLYTRLGGDEVRGTNGIHAAMVEVKNEGAADYWMKGEYTVRLW